ncbi:MAG: phosphoribosylanthranilate isomerase [Pirellulaceae bacterium]
MRLPTALDKRNYHEYRDKSKQQGALLDGDSDEGGESAVFRIKICGIMRVEDAVASANAGAHAIGFNFYPPSPRHVTVGQAQEIAAEVPGEVARVGVFVNASAEEMLETARRVGLDFLQLHGDEPPELLAELTEKGAQTIRAFRCGDDGLTPVLEYLERCKHLACLPRAVLLDAKVPGVYGGTGKVVDWNLLRPYTGWIMDCPILLAGGLTTENVKAAINTAHPWGVDTASGVESSPGLKDIQRIQQFVAAALQHYDD